MDSEKEVKPDSRTESKARTAKEIADHFRISMPPGMSECLQEMIESYATEYAAEKVREAKCDVELAHRIVDGMAEGYKAGQIACAQAGHVTREQFKQYAEQVEASAFRAGQIAMRERAGGTSQDWAESYPKNSEIKRMLYQLSGTIRSLSIEEKA